jgi:hypothetical protein
MHSSRTEALNAYCPTELGQRGDPVHPVVESMLPGNDGWLKEHYGQLDCLLDAIHQYNPTMLPALLHPDPLLSQPAPREYAFGSPSEAYFMLLEAAPTWNRIPGASLVLEKRFGRNPKYNSYIVPELR